MEFREAAVRVETADLLAAHAYYGDAGEVAEMTGLHAPDSIYELPSGVVGHGAGEVNRLLGGRRPAVVWTAGALNTCGTILQLRIWSSLARRRQARALTASIENSGLAWIT